MRTLLVSLRGHVSSHVHAKRRRVELPGPLVSFSFDDVPAVTFEPARALFDKHGCRGTFYVSGRLCTAGGAFLSADQVRALADDGHEIGCHTFSHCLTGRVGTGRLRSDLLRNREFLGRAVPGVVLESFSYPAGSIGLWNKPVIAALYASSRSTGGGINAGQVDLHTLRAQRLYTGSTTDDRISALLATAAARRGWLIFYTHDVAARPSPVGCTPELLDRALAAARQCGAEIVTVGEAVRRIAPDPPACW